MDSYDPFAHNLQAFFHGNGQSRSEVTLKDIDKVDCHQTTTTTTSFNCMYNFRYVFNVDHPVLYTWAYETSLGCLT